jgi:hypothetical protein
VVSCCQFMVMTQVEACCCFSGIDVLVLVFFSVVSFSISVGPFVPYIILLLSFNAMICNSPTCSRKKPS